MRTIAEIQVAINEVWDASCEGMIWAEKAQWRYEALFPLQEEKVITYMALAEKAGHITWEDWMSLWGAATSVFGTTGEAFKFIAQWRKENNVKLLSENK